MGFDPARWNFCMKNIAHYFLSGGVGPSGQSEVAKVKRSATTRQRRAIRGGDFYQLA